MKFKVGPVLPLEGNGREAHEKAVRFITDTLREWGVEVKDSGSAESARQEPEERS